MQCNNNWSNLGMNDAESMMEVLHKIPADFWDNLPD